MKNYQFLTQIEKKNIDGKLIVDFLNKFPIALLPNQELTEEQAINLILHTFLVKEGKDPEKGRIKAR